MFIFEKKITQSSECTHSAISLVPRPSHCPVFDRRPLPSSVYLGRQSVIHMPHNLFSLTYVQVVGERFRCISEASWCGGGILPFQCLSCKPSLFQCLNGPTHTVQWYPGVEGRSSIKTVQKKNYSVDSAYYKQ